MNKLKQKSIDGVIWNITEKIGIQLIKLVLGVILARLLTPADYGLIGMIAVFFSVASVFIDSGFGLAYIQKQDVNEIDASTIFYFNFTVSILFYIILWFTAPFIASFYNEIQLVSLIRVMSIILVINSFGLIQLAKLTKDIDFKKKTILILISSVLASGAGIFAALSNFGVWSLVIQELVRATVKNLGLWIFYKWRPLLKFEINSLKSMLSFSLWAFFIDIVKTIFNNIYILTIGKFFPAAQLGYYTKAKQFQGIISRTPSNAIGTVAFPILSKLQGDKVALKNAMKKFIQYAVFFIAPLSAIFFVIAKPLFLILLTEKWLPMVNYFQLLIIVGVFFPIHMINVQLLSSQGKMKLSFNISLIKNTLRVLNIIIMYKHSVLYIIYGELVVSILSLGINTYYSKKIVGYGLIEQFKDLSKILITTIILAFFGYFISSVIEKDLLKILIVVVFMSTSYLISMFFFEKKLLYDNFEIIKNKLSLGKR